jgi:hypothetical protein
MSSSITPYKNTYRSIFYELPPGKPNPYQSAEETQDRVLQKAQKGGTCWWYALNYLRPRYRNVNSKELSEARKIEQENSLLRKQFSSALLLEEISEARRHLFPQATDREVAEWFFANQHILLLTYQPHSQFKHGTVPHYSGSHRILKRQIVAILSHELPYSLESVLLLKQFISQNVFASINSFLMNQTADFCLDFLQKREISIQKFCHDLSDRFRPILTQRRFSNNLLWENLSTSSKYCLLYSLSIKVIAESFSLEESTWKPAQGIKALISELKHYGPLYVTGYFGRGRYRTAPYLCRETINGNPLYRWDESTRIPQQTNDSSHAIVITGAAIKKKNSFIYFRDPSDQSDPRIPCSDKYYKIYYTTFISHLLTDSIIYPSTSGKPFFQQSPIMRKQQPKESHVLD